MLTPSAILWHDLDMNLYVYPNEQLPMYCVISENPVFGVFELDEEGVMNTAVALPWSEVPELITALRRAYNARPGQQPQADGVVASVLLQNAVANAPGDFS